MSWNWMRPSLRGMMIAVALCGLNLFAATDVASHLPARRLLPVTIGMGQGFVSYRADGIIELGSGGVAAGNGPSRFVVDRPPRSFLSICSPLIASVALTLAILSLRPGPLASGRPLSRTWRMTRRISLSVSLAALCVAGFVHDDPPEILGIPLDRLLLSDESTILHGADGSLIAYRGDPWRLNRPRVVRPPTRSILQIWLPMISSATLAAWLAFVAMRSSGRPRGYGQAPAMESFRRIDGLVRRKL